MMRPFIIAVCLLTNYLLLSQTTIPISHIPRIGDTFLFAVDTALYTPKPFSGGLYDFSDLKMTDSSRYLYTANTNPVSYPAANLKLLIDTNEQASTYFKTTANDVFVVALSNLSSQIPFPNVSNLKGSLKFMTTPFTSTTNITTYDSIKFSIPASFIPPQLNIDSILKTLIPGLPTGATVSVDSISVSIAVKLNLYADGQGKIKTPIDNNLDVLKLVRKISFTPKIVANGKGTFGPVTLPINYDVTSLLTSQFPINQSDIVTHSYVSPTYRQEIINTTVDSMGRYQGVNYRYKTKNAPNTASISAENNQDIDFIFQNETIQVLNLSNVGASKLSIYTMEGKKMLEEYVDKSHHSIQWNGLPNKLYIIQLARDHSVITKKYQFR